MNKLGFYVEKTTDRLLRDALQKVKPPVMLIHAQNRGLLHDIRRGLSPDTFIIGRLFKNQQEQEAMLDNGHPETSGREYALEILHYDFGFAREKSANDRPLIDAWMSLNELPPGPASYPGFQVDDTFKRRAEHYDRFQDSFRQQLESEGVDAVAFNFAAGNYIEPEHYLQWFPRTLESYIYLGFHEYGWPSLKPSADGHTAALFYRNCMEGIREVHGPRHQVIITESGLTMAYGQPANPDHGWLNTIEPLTEEQYWQSLAWYNEEMLKDEYVLGACLFQVGHTGRWETFRHFGTDDQSNAITVIPKIATLGSSLPRPAAPERKTPLRALLDERIGVLEPNLPSALAIVESLSAQMERNEAQVVILEPKVEQAQTAALLATHCRIRLDQVQSTLDALNNNGSARSIDSEALQENASILNSQLLTMEPHAEAMNQAGAQVRSAKLRLPAQQRQVQQTTVLAGGLKRLLDQTHALRNALPPDPFLAQTISAAPPPVSQPDLLDVCDQLPRHPAKRYHVRDLETIRRIVVHQTGFSPTTPPEALASVQIIRKDAPGITYHFVINGNGDVFWTQSLEQILQNTLHYEINADSVSVALAGDFSKQVPDPQQMAAAADVIAWLVSELGLGIDDVVGRSELEDAISPGLQWRHGARYKKTLFGLMRAKLLVE